MGIMLRKSEIYFIKKVNHLFFFIKRIKNDNKTKRVFFKDFFRNDFIENKKSLFQVGLIYYYYYFTENKKSIQVEKVFYSF